MLDANELNKSKFNMLACIFLQLQVPPESLCVQALRSAKLLSLSQKAVSLPRDGRMYATSSGRALKGYPTPLRVNKACEEQLLAVFASLRRCIECGPLTRAEVYLGNIKGRLIFFPGLPMRWSICGGWSLDLCSLEASLCKKA